MSDDLREIVRETLRKQAAEQEEARISAVPRHQVTALGRLQDGRLLSFDNRARIFLLDAHPVDLSEVRTLDRRGAIQWRYLEQRDWMRRLSAQAYAKAFRKEQERLGSTVGYAGLNEQLRRHASKDDSYLHGQIVDTNQEEEAVEAVLRTLAAEQNEPKEPGEPNSQNKRSKPQESNN